MERGMGWNIHLSYCTDSYIDELIAEFKVTKPGALLLMDSFGDSVGDTLRFARELPETTIIYRRFIPDDQQFNRSVEQWGAEAAPFRGTRVYVATTNEPPARQSFEYLTRAIKHAKANGIKIAVGAYSVGTPHESDMPYAVTMLREMAAYPGGTLLEAHEYERALMAHTVAPDLKHPSQWPVNVDYGKDYFRLMRFKEWFMLCALMFINAPKIVISEWGWDRVDDVPAHVYGDTQGLMTLPGVWQSWGFGDWEKYAADQLKWAWNKLYKPYGVDVCFFCRHNQPVDPSDPEKLWQNFNAHRAPRFLALTREGFEPMAISYTPYQGGNYTLNGNGVRIRAGAGLSHATRTTLANGAPVMVRDNRIISADDYGWQEVVSGIHVGWMAVRGNGVTWSLTPVTEPEPDPEAVFIAAYEAKAKVVRDAGNEMLLLVEAEKERRGLP